MSLRTIWWNHVALACGAGTLALVATVLGLTRRVSPVVAFVMAVALAGSAAVLAPSRRLPRDDA